MLWPLPYCLLSCQVQQHILIVIGYFFLFLSVMSYIRLNTQNIMRDLMVDTAASLTDIEREGVCELPVCC